MNKFQILVVEDDSPIRNLIATTLKTHNYKYLLAQNGEEAIIQASTHDPDVVFLDLVLPYKKDSGMVKYAYYCY